MACNKFYNDIKILNASGESVDAGAAEVAFYNTGQSIAYVNGVIPVLPFQMLTMPGANNIEEIDITEYHVVFSDNTVQNSLVVIRKVFR